MYSASDVDDATVGYFFDFPEIGGPSSVSLK